MSKVLPMTRKNKMPVSLKPKMRMAMGTQQTLGRVCRPRKTGAFLRFAFAT